MRMSWLIFSVLLCASAARSDTVEMKDSKLVIEGKVKSETDEYIILLVHHNKGELRLLKSQIERIEYDIKTQLEVLKEDDYAGHYRVGVWAMQKGLYADAINVFEYVMKGVKEDNAEGAGPDMLKLLGKAYEQRQQLDKALESYNDYLKVQPNDAEVTARIQELAKEMNPDDSSRKQQTSDGLEKNGNWTSENWGIPNKWQLQDQDGNKIIAVQSLGGPDLPKDKQKVTFSHTCQPPLDLSDSKEMIFRVFHNSPTPVSIGIAFINAQGEFLESKPMPAGPNSWNALSLKLDGKDFKAAKCNWEHKLELEGKEKITRIIFLIYRQPIPFKFYLDAVYFKRADKGGSSGQ